MRTVNSKTNNFVLFAWLILTLSALVVSVHSYRQNGIEHNILALVPEDAVDKRIDETNRNFLTSLERTLFFALSDETAAKDLKTRLEDSGVCQAVFGQIQPDKQRAIYAFLNSHRLAFIDPSTRDLLADPQAYSAWVMAQVFNPFAGIGHAELSGDPLLLIRRAQSSLTPSGNAALKKGWIVAGDKTGKTFYLVEASLKNGISVTDAVVSVNQILKTVQKDHPGTLALRQGIPFYTASGLESAKDDVSVLGTLSLVGLLAIFWLAFRSIRPFLLCAVSLLTGLIFATAATYLVFDSVHAAALVMSTSLIGISADYTTYYLTRRMRFGLSETAFQTRDRLKTTLLHAVGTSSLAYGVMLLAPLPGLRQFALFGAVGLMASCLTVLIAFPYLVAQFPVRNLALHPLFSRWVNLWTLHPLRMRSMCLIGVAVCALGIARLQISDDLTGMQTPDASLRANEAHFAKLFGRDMTQHWFVVLGPSSDDVLAREKALIEKLTPLKMEGKIAAWDAFAINTETEQAHLLPIYEKTAAETRKALGTVGMTLPHEKAPQTLRLADFLASDIARAYRGRISQLQDGSWGLILPVMNVQDESAMRQACQAVQGTFWYSRKGAFENIFRTCRITVSSLLALSFAAVFLVFACSFGLKAGALCAGCSLLSLVAALGIMGWIGIPLQIFSLFALILVLGIGIDYIVFFYRHNRQAVDVSFAVTIAMVTTVLSLGILVLSRTAAISNFGLVLFLGITAAYLIAPLVLTIKRQ
ncbi:MAG: hypothetical protein MR720_00600 [Sutterella sp.]|nr:hypothetical protein [Sutterella sp.]